MSNMPPPHPVVKALVSIMIFIFLVAVTASTRAFSVGHCTCTRCKPLSTEEESTCCKEAKINKDIIKGDYLIFWGALI